jgi:hypothetical protein
VLLGEFAFSVENFGHNAFRAKNICKVPLPQPVRLDQVTQNINWGGIRDRIAVSLEILDQKQ